MTTCDSRPRWLELYAEAVLEPDPTADAVRIAHADQAIQCRLFELQNTEPSDETESQRLILAMYFLQLLRQNMGMKDDG